MNLNQNIKDADTILSKAKKEKVKTPIEFAKVYKENPPKNVSKKEIDTQIKAIHDFSEGKMDYATMRGMCG